MPTAPAKPDQVIAAIRDEHDLTLAIQSKVRCAFLLGGDLQTLNHQCSLLHEAGKSVFLHFDLVNGLKGDASGILYAAEHFRLNGIISTRPPCLKLAREAGLLAILRVFVLDSSALKTGLQHAQSCQPDFVEVLPGVAPKIIRLACAAFNLPVIAGGLIQDRDDISQALHAGAAAVSTSRAELWN